MDYRDATAGRRRNGERSHETHALLAWAREEIQELHPHQEPRPAVERALDWLERWRQSEALKKDRRAAIAHATD